MAVRLQLLGSPTIECGGAPVLLPFERRTQLLVWLALRGRWTGRAEIAALLWPEQTASLALMYLRKTLFRLRGLPWAGHVQVQGDSLRVEADTDLQRFEHALHEQRPQEALALHAGPLLAGFDDDANEAWTGWLQFERTRVQSAWRAAVLAWLESGAVDGAPALQWSARLLEADPLDEAAVRLHMTLLARSGQAARAHQTYRDFAARLADDLGITPGPELKTLHAALGQAGATVGAEPAGLSPAATATPAADASGDAGFIGRAVERRRIHDLLSSDAVRLVCIVGPGGIGKTRLARRALHDLETAFVDGAHFVALEDVANADELARRVAASAGLALQGREPPLQQLSQALGEGQRLLVLDNFEQLAGAACALQTLLAACPRLKLLVTSRLRLGLNTEHLLPLEGLPCPGPEDLDRFAAFDAARLFVSAAQRVEPTLAAAAEAAAIVDICRQVDGMPLALELAAAWTRVLSCQTIALELRSGIALLQAHGGANPPRHASIEHVFEQSWRHLGTAERQTLARLSIFHGGFTADAARAVATCALPVLASLADKSLLRKEGQQLSLHPLVQQFAAARLTAVERATTQAAHALYFHRLLAQLGAGVDLGERLALRAVDDELQNYLAALDWAIRQGQAEATQRCADVLCKYLEHRGGFGTGLQLLNRAIEARHLQEHGALQAWLRCRSAQFLYRLERYAEAEAVAQEALRGASRSADASIRLHALNVVALCALRQGRLASARLLFRQVHALASTQPDGRLTASTLDHLALVEKRLGHYAEALRLSLEALAQHRAEGDEARLALCLNNLATLYLSREKRDAAASHLREALAICERNGLAATMAYVLANLIEVAMASGAQAQAETYAARALDIAESCGSRATHIWVQAQQGRLAVRRGDMAAAATTLAVALSRAHESAPSQGCKPALLGFAELLHASGDPECAQRVLGIAAAHTSMGAHERDELLAQMARWADGAETGAAAPPTVDYAELVHRIVSEAPDGHTGLRGLLRSGATTTPSPC